MQLGLCTCYVRQHTVGANPNHMTKLHLSGADTVPFAGGTRQRAPTRQEVKVGVSLQSSSCALCLHLRAPGPGFSQPDLLLDGGLEQAGRVSGERRQSFILALACSHVAVTSCSERDSIGVKAEDGVVPTGLRRLTVWS